MNLVLAQAQDMVVTSLVQVGAVGAVLVWMMIRDGKREERDAARNDERDLKLDRVTDALNHLTRAISLEVLTRPNVVERAKNEAQEILTSIDQRGK